MEKNADAIKPFMANYLEFLTAVLDTNHDDVDELRKVYAELDKDANLIANIRTNLNEHIGYLANTNTKKAEIANRIAAGVRERKAQ